MKWVCESCSSRNLGSAAQVKSTGSLVQGPSSTPPARLSRGAWGRLHRWNFASRMPPTQGTSSSIEGNSYHACRCVGAQRGPQTHKKTG